MNFYKLFIHYLPRYKWYLIAYIILLVLSALCSVFSFAAIIPVLQILFGISNANIKYVDLGICTSVSDYLDGVVNNILYYLQEQISINGPTHVLLLLVLFILGMSLLNNITSYFAYYFRIPIRTGIARDIRQELYSKITEIPANYFSKDNKGDFVSRMTSDAEEVEYGIASALDMLIENPVDIIVYLVTLFGLSWRLTTVAVAMLIVCVAIVLRIGSRMKKIAKRGQTLRGEILSIFEETLTALRVIKSHNLESQYINSFSFVNESTRKAFNHLNRQYSLAFPISDFLAMSIVTILLWYGGQHILNDEFELSPSEFIYYLMIFVSLIPPIRSVMKATFAVRKSMASVERINKIVTITSSTRECTHPIPLPTFTPNDTPEIEYRNVCFQYTENRLILDKLNFTIQKGQKVALIGKTGSGKTTIVELLLRMMDVTSGSILINGVNIKDVALKDLRDYISYVNQETILFNDTILNNIVLGNNTIPMSEVENVSKIVGIHDFIIGTKDGYYTIVGDRGALLSGGQRQSICLARALLKPSSILVLDEATSALDSATEIRVLTSIINGRDGTVLFISHNNNVVQMADSIIHVKLTEQNSFLPVLYKDNMDKLVIKCP